MIICTDLWLSLFSFEMELLSVFQMTFTSLWQSAFYISGYYGKLKWEIHFSLWCNAYLIINNIVYLHNVNEVINSYLTGFIFMLFCVF